MHAAPNAFASFTSFQAGIATGGFHRAAPTGGSAYGIPLKIFIFPCASPETAPVGARTTGVSAITAMDKRAAKLHTIMCFMDDFTARLPFLPSSAAATGPETK